MKFTGLILICATSCLALILPAIGVVEFPNVQRLQAEPNSSGFLANAATESSNRAWNPAANSSDLGANPGYYPNASAPATNPTSSPFSPTVTVTPTLASQAAASSSNKLGMGMWLLLAPVCMLGLALWTFAPNPSGSKPKYSKS